MSGMEKTYFKWQNTSYLRPNLKQSRKACKTDEYFDFLTSSIKTNKFQTFVNILGLIANYQMTFFVTKSDQFKIGDASPNLAILASVFVPRVALRDTVICIHGNTLKLSTHGNEPTRCFSESFVAVCR